jgi:predicted aspartyl protease
MARNALAGRPALEVRDAVIADVRRAAELIDTGLSSFVIQTVK